MTHSCIVDNVLTVCRQSETSCEWVNEGTNFQSFSAFKDVIPCKKLPLTSHRGQEKNTVLIKNLAVTKYYVSVEPSVLGFAHG